MENWQLENWKLAIGKLENCQLENWQLKIGKLAIGKLENWQNSPKEFSISLIVQKLQAKK